MHVSHFGSDGMPVWLTHPTLANSQRVHRKILQRRPILLARHFRLSVRICERRDLAFEIEEMRVGKAGGIGNDGGAVPPNYLGRIGSTEDVEADAARSYVLPSTAFDIALTLLCNEKCCGSEVRRQR